MKSLVDDETWMLILGAKASTMRMTAAKVIATVSSSIQHPQPKWLVSVALLILGCPTLL